jgi:hypothetical protein
VTGGAVSVVSRGPDDGIHFQSPHVTGFVKMNTVIRPTVTATD